MPTTTRRGAAHSLLAASLLAVVLWTPATALGERDAARDDAALLPLRDIRTFSEVFHHIKNAYIEETDDETLFRYAIQGMLNGLDPHSGYLDARAFNELDITAKGKFGGVGIEVAMDADGFVRVISPVDDTPAQRAGIESGDRIVRVNGKSTRNMQMPEVLEMLRGPPGSAVSIRVARDAMSLGFDLVRDIIAIDSVRSRMLEPGFGYLRIAQFQANTAQEMASHIRELADDSQPGGLKGLIVDVRNNPGGVLHAAVGAADLFLERGLIVYTKGRHARSRIHYSAGPGDIVRGRPIALLINGGSASASEILAGALQDHRRAVVVGETSFGKGSAQNVLPLPDGGAVKLTTQRYFTPKGRSIQATGVEPDIVVARARLALSERAAPRFRETDLHGHLEGEADDAAAGASSGAAESSERASSRYGLLAEDNQLFEALNLVKGMHLMAASERADANRAAADGGPQGHNSDG